MELFGNVVDKPLEVDGHMTHAVTEEHQLHIEAEEAALVFGLTAWIA